MFADYEKVVLADYHQKKLAGNLRLRLIYPTPGKLKEECIVVLNERHSVKDHKALSDFFELQAGQQIIEQTIRRFDRDKFRPLANFLKNPEINTDPKNIELLAWLIDFQPRPHELGKEYNAVSITKPAAKVEEAQGSAGQNERVVAGEAGEVKEKIDKFSTDTGLYGKPYFKFKSIVLLASITVIVITGLLYWILNYQHSRENLNRKEQCMYWAGDHYERVSCSRKFGDTLVIAFDSVRFHRLKKISNPDTITLNAIGKVWYIKRDNQLEFYTSNGYHPEDIKSRLRPITAYIIRKYILPNKGTEPQ